MASNTDIKINTGIKLKYLSEKQNDRGTNHFFAVLDETTLKEVIELEDMQKPIWGYNGKKYYLKINAVKVKNYLLKLALKRVFLMLWIKPFQNMIFRRVENRLQVIEFLKLIRIY